MSSPTPTPEPTHDEGRTRRVHVRFPCGRETAVHMAQEESCIFQPVRVFDMSVGGVALLLWEPMEKGAEVFIQLGSRALDATLELPAKVAHISQMAGDKWLVGFAFNSPLKEEELAQFL